MKILALVLLAFSAPAWATDGSNGAVKDSAGFSLKNENFVCSIPVGSSGTDLLCRSNRPLKTLEINVPSNMCTYLYLEETIRNDTWKKLYYVAGTGTNIQFVADGNQLVAQCLDAAEDIANRITVKFGE
jgi:hypothetical protein